MPHLLSPPQHALAPRMTSLPIVRLRPKEGRRARHGAPWIYSNEIEMAPKTKALTPGTLVSATGADGHEFGTGYFNPKSLIAIRLLEKAQNATIDAAYFEQRLGRALALRQALYDRPYYRLVHAEGDDLPG